MINWHAGMLAEYDMPSNLGDLFKVLFSAIQNTLRRLYVIFSAAYYKSKEVIRKRDYGSINQTKIQSRCQRCNLFYMLTNNSLFHTLFCVCSGLIGRSWAMVFISGGYNVKLYDNQPGQAAKAITEIR